MRWWRRFCAGAPYLTLDRLSSPPQGSLNRIDGFGQDMYAWQAAPDGVDHALTHEADFFEDAAGEGNPGNWRIGVEVPDVTEGLDCVFTQNSATQFQHIQGYGVSLLCALDDDRSEL